MLSIANDGELPAIVQSVIVACRGHFVNSSYCGERCIDAGSCATLKLNCVFPQLLDTQIEASFVIECRVGERKLIEHLGTFQCESAERETNHVTVGRLKRAGSLNSPIQPQTLRQRRIFRFSHSFLLSGGAIDSACVRSAAYTIGFKEETRVGLVRKYVLYSEELQCKLAVRHNDSQHTVEFRMKSCTQRDLISALNSLCAALPQDELPSLHENVITRKSIARLQRAFNALAIEITLSDSILNSGAGDVQALQRAQQETDLAIGLCELAQS
jgi:hypothetical protein